MTVKSKLYLLLNVKSGKPNAFVQVVAPKKAALAEAEGELQMQMNTLNEKRAQLQGVLDKLQVRTYRGNQAEACN